MSDPAAPHDPARPTFVELRPRPEAELMAARSAVPGAARRATAVIVVHGMGQQVPFETLEMVANALRAEEESRRATARGQHVTVDMVMLGDTRIARAELRVQDHDGAPRDVHLYEAYWAPVTEGRVSIRDTLRFLIGAGLTNLIAFVRGLFRVDERTFDRWMFGRWVRFKIRRARTALELAGVLLALVSLIVINAIVAAVMASRTLTGGSAPWPGPGLFRQLTLDLVLLAPAAIAIVTGCMGVPNWLRPAARAHRRPAVAARPGSIAGWILVSLGLAAIPLIAAFMLIHVVFGPGPLASAAALDTRWTLFAWGAWIAAFGVSLGARWFLVEYVGDVAAYISSHTVSKFWDVRHQIHELSMEVARAVYGARVAREHLYDRVVVAGHSLGSVVAYDMLNNLILEDRLKGLPYDAAHRTEMLFTFGSPLEKTAYLFRTQRPHRAEVREALAATVQPMIQSYVSRRRFWVNLFSPNDWTGGELRFYDAEQPPEGGTWRVENIPDPDADQPLLAHNQYWDGAALRGILLDGVSGAWQPGVHGRQGARGED
ncbi:MAG: hypothetical protein HYR73_06195 [Candidatus Eisenbacteria bacterium]|nr:hypothetical protein [Candidatus Eisenbacteria bacterium]